MYQIEKNKNDMALKFIGNLVKKIKEKYPHLVNLL
jgi:hypothetical protein